MTGIINKPLLLHRVDCLYNLYQWCMVKQISDNEIYLLIKYVKSILLRVAKRLSYIQDAWCLKVKILSAVLVKSPVSWQYACPECNYLPCNTVCIPEGLNLNDDISMSDCGKMLALLPSMWSRTNGFNALFFTCPILLFTCDKVRTVYVSNTMPHQCLGSAWSSWSYLLPSII